MGMHAERASLQQLEMGGCLVSVWKEKKKNPPRQFRENFSSENFSAAPPLYPIKFSLPLPHSLSSAWQVQVLRLTLSCLFLCEGDFSTLV